jgi:quercetin dioxygenase-like cupin family protein
MRNRYMLALTAALVGVVAIGGVVLATSASGVTSTPIATGSLDPVNLNVKTGDWMAQLRTKGQTSVQVVENRVAPGGTFGWHSHPGPSLIIVKSGTITFYHGDDPTCTPDVRSAGDALVDEGTDVHVGRNEGTADVVVIVTRLLPVGAPARIDEPDPGNCGF